MHEHAPVAGFISDTSPRTHRFAVQGVFWRNALDWGVQNVPAFLHPFFILFWTVFFFFFAGNARRAAHRQLGIILPGSSALLNYLRTLRVFHSFAWSLTDAAILKLQKVPFECEVVGEALVKELAAAERAIILTAHMGNYDLGAALFTEKFNREIRMVRAPEPDNLSASHLGLSLQKASGGAVTVDYNTAGSSLSFDLLAALRAGQIVSIQGDRILGDVARASVKLFNRDVLLPTGPFVLSLVADTAIYPLFVIRDGFRRYKIIAHSPIRCSKERSRESAIASAMVEWTGVVEQMIGKYWYQWYAFTPVFE